MWNEELVLNTRTLQRQTSLLTRTKSHQDRFLTSDFRLSQRDTACAALRSRTTAARYLAGARGPAFLEFADPARVADLAVHAWVLMPDAMQFLVTPSYEWSVAVAMQAISRRYVGPSTAAMDAAVRCGVASTGQQ